MKRAFATQEACLAYLEALRWPGGVACLRCGSPRVATAVSTVRSRKTGKVTKARHLYDCLEVLCRHQFSALTGTLFHDSHLPLPDWFLAVALLSDPQGSITIRELQRRLGIGSYRTAWHLAHRIRGALELEGGLLKATALVGEAFAGD